MCFCDVFFFTVNIRLLLFFFKRGNEKIKIVDNIISNIYTEFF